MHDIAVLDGVIGALKTHLAGVLGARLAAAGDKVLIGDRLGADEALLEIRMDAPGSLRRLGTARHCPSSRLLRACGEEGNQVQQLISGADHPIEAGLAETERGEILGALLRIREMSEVCLDRGGNPN